jgi:hypothetical protein
MGISASDLNPYERPQDSAKRNQSAPYLDPIESNGKSALILNHHQGSVKAQIFINCRSIKHNGILVKEFLSQGKTHIKA